MKMRGGGGRAAENVTLKIMFALSFPWMRVPDYLADPIASIKDELSRRELPECDEWAGRLVLETCGRRLKVFASERCRVAILPHAMILPSQLRIAKSTCVTRRRWRFLAATWLLRHGSSSHCDETNSRGPMM